MNHIVTTTLLVITSGLITTEAFTPLSLRRQQQLLQRFPQPHHPPQKQQQQQQQRQPLYILDNPILGESTSSSPPPLESPSSSSSDDNTLLSTLCRSLNATFPTAPLQFSPPKANRPRGLVTTSPLSPDDPILLIPLSSCLTSDDPLPPSLSSSSSRNPSEWAVHLAALLLHHHQSSSSQNTAWHALLPTPSSLRSTLPVHWDDATLSHARSSALELLADAAYFSRAAAVDVLLERFDDVAPDDVHHALDVVQTRACRVDRASSLLVPQGRPPLRIVAPVFDFLNHGGRRGANAAFALEEEMGSVMLVVRATRTIGEGEEVLLDYGESARPSWRCLANYGFLMEDGRDDEEDEMMMMEEDEEEDVAEVFLNGVRYEVGRDSVPVDMVEAMADLMREEECGGGGDGIGRDREEEGERGLTAGVALRIAKRVSDVAFDLLMVEDKNDVTTTTTSGSGSSSSTKAEETIVAEKLAERLRWRQHRVLMACATGLREYASEKMGME